MRVIIDMEGERVLFAADDGAVTREYELLFTFVSEETEKSYVVYTDGSEDEEGNMRVYAASYDPDSMAANDELSDSENAMIERFIASILEDDPEDDDPGEEQLEELTRFVREMMDEHGEDVKPEDMP